MNSPPVNLGSRHGSLYSSSDGTQLPSGSQPYDTLGSIKDSRRSVTNTKPFVDYNSLVKYVMAADIEIIEWSKLQITGTLLGAGAYMKVFRGSCIERFGGLSLAIKKFEVPMLRGSSDLPQFTDKWMEHLAVMSLELRVLSDKLLRSHPNIVRLLGISFEIYDPNKNAEDNQDSENNSPENSKSSEDKFFKPILIFEEAHRDYPTLEKFYDHAKAQGHSIPMDVRVALWTGIAYALSAVHIVGVVHGDIKPANILLFENASNGRLTAKLSDFGGCQPSDDSDERDQYQLLGTEFWNAPEAYDCGHPHHRSIYRDIYSFGLLGFFILFGSQRFGNPEGRLPSKSDDLYTFKSNWKGLSHLVITMLRLQLPPVMTKEARKHLQSLPQATDFDSFKARFALYRQYMGSGAVQIGIRTKYPRADGFLGIRLSENADYRPFAMALAMTLFIHPEPEKRDEHEILGNLSIFLNDKGVATNLRDLYGSECWSYVLELLVTDRLVPWQLTDIDKSPLQGRKTRLSWVTQHPADLTSSNLLSLDQLISVPESLRTILKGEYESRLQRSAPGERIDCLLALASLSIDSPATFLRHYFEAAQLGSQVARAFCVKLGPKPFAHYHTGLSQKLNKWALEATLSSMKRIGVFMETLEKACPSILESEEVRIELTESAHDLHLMCKVHGECSPWLPDSTLLTPEPALAALKAVVKGDLPTLRKTIAACNSVLDARFVDEGTLVHVAAEFDRAEMLTWLFSEYNIDMELQNSKDMTPLATATLHNSHDAMTALLNLGAEYKRILSARMAAYLANISAGSMIDRFVGLRDVLEREWIFLPNMTRACPSLTELLDGNFSFFDDHFPESEVPLTPIFASILGNNLSSLQELLQHGCSQDVWATFAASSQVRHAPIHLACQLRPLHLAVLLHYGADVHLETDDKLRQTPLHFACTAIKRPSYMYPCSPLDWEIADFSLPMLAETRLCMLRLLRSYGLTNVNAQDALGKTALHHCAWQQGCLPVMQELVLEFEADLEIQDVQLMTPLHHITAKEGQDLDYLKFCLSKLSDDAIDKPDVYGHTPLMWCASAQRGEDSIDFCNCLITRGCSLALRSRAGETVLHMATREPGDDELFAYVYDEVVRLDLLSSLSDLRDIHGRTFAHSMARSENARIRHHLQRLPPNILRKLINKADLEGFTTLHEAARAGDEVLVRILMENGGNLHQKAVDGLLPICIAHAAGHSAVVELLQQEPNLLTEDIEAWTSERWTRTMNQLEKEEYARMEKFQDKINAETESRKRLYRTG